MERVMRESDSLLWGEHFLSWGWHLQCLHCEWAEGERRVAQWSLKDSYITSLWCHMLFQRNTQGRVREVKLSRQRSAKVWMWVNRTICVKTLPLMLHAGPSNPVFSLDLLWFLVPSILNNCTLCSCSKDQTFVLTLLPLQETGEGSMNSWSWTLELISYRKYCSILTGPAPQI